MGDRWSMDAEDEQRAEDAYWERQEQRRQEEQDQEEEYYQQMQQAEYEHWLKTEGFNHYITNAVLGGVL
jgi:hypothetical protein